MVAAKSTSSKRKSKKLSLKKQTLKDLSAGSKAKEIKGGTLIDCHTRLRQTG